MRFGKPLWYAGDLSPRDIVVSESHCDKLNAEIVRLEEREAVLVGALTTALDWIDTELEGQDEINTHVIMATHLRKALSTVSDIAEEN